MYALLSLLIIISLSLLVVRVGSVALRMTGVSPEVASFQALSAFSGAGFTTDEVEAIVEYPSRRTVVKTLIRLGSAGAVTAISSLVLSFMDPTTRLRRLVVLLAFLAALVVLARSRWFNDLLTQVIEAALSRVATFELRDYTSLLDLHRDYSVADLEVEEGDWLADERLADMELRSAEGVAILGIYREDGTYVGAPSGEDRIVAGDTVVAYGKEDRLRELVDRDEDDRVAHREAKAEFSRTQAQERRRDPEHERERPVAE